ncbi:tryptophan 7-halogenase [Streptomyces capparidis]
MTDNAGTGLMRDRGGAAPPGTEKFDVAVLGGHLASGLLAAVLARHGVRVLLVDTESDVTEVAGETTVPYTAEVFFTLARRFDVPEIASFGLTCDLPADVQRTSGIKRSLGFVHHQAGREQDPAQAVQFNVPGEHSEWHPYRPHVDRYAVELARGHGAVTIPRRPTLTDVIPDENGVTVRVTGGASYRARYVVDGSGADSPLVRRLDCADPVPWLRMRSRVLTTHMHGVRPFEDCVRLADYRRATAWSKGTLSHLFNGGWLQVVHFDNREEPGNHTASVTLSVDPERFPDLPAHPGEAFRQVVDDFPALRRSFADATETRPWTSEEWWQRTVSRTVGDRYFLWDRTASRNDMFLSRDVTMSAEMVHALAPSLIAAARADDWSTKRFEPVAAFQRELIDFNDRLLAAARIATGDFRLWNAYSRVWLLWSVLAALRLKSTRNECLATGRWGDLERFDDGPYWFELPKGLPALLDSLFELTDAVRRGRTTPANAADRLFTRLRGSSFVPPLYRFGDPEDRYYHFTLRKRLRMLLWSRTTAPPEFRRMLTKENLTNVPPPAVH